MKDTPTGLYEALVTARLQHLIDQLPNDRLDADVRGLANAESADRVSRHIARLLAQAIEAMPERERADGAVRLAAGVVHNLHSLTSGSVLTCASPMTRQ